MIQYLYTPEIKKQHISRYNILLYSLPKETIYYELFTEDGVIALNLDRDFKTYYFNEKNLDLSLVFRYGANITLDKLYKEYEIEQKEFNIEKTYKGFMKLRDEVFPNEVNPTKKLIYFFMLANTSAYRKPQWDMYNNLTSTWGAENYYKRIPQFINFINCLYQHKFFSYNLDYREMLEIVPNTKESLVILNQPTYSNISIDNEYIVNWLLNNQNVQFVYFDLNNPLNNTLLETGQVKRISESILEFEECKENEETYYFKVQK